MKLYEISTSLNFEANLAKLLSEVASLGKYDPKKRAWFVGTSFIPTRLIRLDPLTFAIVDPPFLGVIVYNVVNTGEIYFLAAIAIKSMLPQLEIQVGTATALAAQGGF